jgi:hypothetical protein
MIQKAYETWSAGGSVRTAADEAETHVDMTRDVAQTVVFLYG